MWACIGESQALTPTARKRAILIYRVLKGELAYIVIPTGARSPGSESTRAAASVSFIALT